MKKVLFLLLFLAGCSVSRPNFDKAKVEINGRIKLDVEVAKTQKQKAFGLMFQKSLKQDKGMIFIYNGSKPIAMWMKNTYIPLDMFFANDNGVIFKIVENAQPLSLDLIKSGKKVTYVLETNAGFAKRYGIKVGDFLKIKD